MKYKHSIKIVRVINLVLIFLFVWVSLYSQSESKKVKTTIDYLNYEAKRIKSGKYILYNRDSTLNLTGYYADYKKDSLWQFYVNDTVVMVEGNYEDNIRVGIWKYYRVNGILESTGAIKLGRKDGHWKYYNEHGNLSCEGDFDIGDEVPGSFVYYNDMGQELDTIITMSHTINVPQFRDTEFNFDISSRHSHKIQLFYGDAAVSKYIRMGINVPSEVLRVGAGGKARVIICVKPNGEIEILKFMNSFSDSYDIEVARILKTQHFWIPISNEGNPINAIFVIPYSYMAYESRPN